MTTRGLRRGGVGLVGRLFERQELLGSEGLVVRLGSRLDQILQVGPGLHQLLDKLHRGVDNLPREEVSEIDKFAVSLVLDIDDSPPVLAPSDWLAIDNDTALGAHNGEGKHGLTVSYHPRSLLGNEKLTRTRSFSSSSSGSFSSASKGNSLIWWCSISAMICTVSK